MHSPEWNDGFDAAVEHVKKNWDPTKRNSLKLPDRFQFRGDAWSAGYGEGLLVGYNQVFDDKYPGNMGFSINDDGSRTIFYPTGHPALKKTL